MAEPVESGADEDASKASNTGEKKDERTQFYELDFNELNRDRTPEERRKWNSIYASYRGHSAIRQGISGQREIPASGPPRTEYKCLSFPAPWHHGYTPPAGH